MEVIRFIADGRTEPLSALLDAWTAVRAAGKPRVINLVGRSGVGKTRVVQEFYEQLARNQKAWPRSLADEGGLIRDQRKRISIQPRGVKNDGLPWLWLGIDCNVQRGGALDGIARIPATLETWVPAAFTESSLKALDAKGAAQELALQGVELAASATGLGIIVSMLKRAVTAAAVREHTKGLERFQQSYREYDVVSEVAERAWASIQLASSTGAGLPLVVVFEDAHEADPCAVLLMRLLTDRAIRESLRAENNESGRDWNLPVLVVNLAWPEAAHRMRSGATAVDETFASLLNEWNEDGGTLARRIELTGLSEQQMIKHARNLLPHTEQRDLTRLVEGAQGNPLMLALRVEIAEARGLVLGGRVIDPAGWAAALAELPIEISDAFAALWEMLDPEVRDILVLASVQGSEFDRNAAVAVATEVGFRGFSNESLSAHQAVERAIEPFSWVRHSDAIDGFLSFYEPIRFGLAKRALDSTERPGLTEATLRFLLAQRQSGEWDRFTDLRRAALMDSLVLMADDCPELPLDVALGLAKTLESAEHGPREDSRRLSQALEFFLVAEEDKRYWEDQDRVSSDVTRLLLTHRSAVGTREQILRFGESGATRLRHLDRASRAAAIERLCWSAICASRLGWESTAHPIARAAVAALGSPSSIEEARLRTSALTLLEMWPEAITSQEWLISELDRIKPTPRARLLAELSLYSWLQQSSLLPESVAAASEAWERCVELAESSGNPAELRWALEGLAQSLDGTVAGLSMMFRESVDQRLRPARPQQMLRRKFEVRRRLLEIAEDDPDPQTLSDAFSNLARALRDLGEREESVKTARAHVDAMRNRNAPMALVQSAMASFASNLWQSKLPGAHKEAVRVQRERLHLARKDGDSELVDDALRGLGFILSLPCDSPQSATVSSEIVELARERVELAQDDETRFARVGNLIEDLMKSPLESNQEEASDLLSTRSDRIPLQENGSDRIGPLTHIATQHFRHPWPSVWARGAELMRAICAMRMEAGDAEGAARSRSMLASEFLKLAASGSLNPDEVGELTVAAVEEHRTALEIRRLLRNDDLVKQSLSDLAGTLLRSIDINPSSDPDDARRLEALSCALDLESLSRTTGDDESLCTALRIRAFVAAPLVLPGSHDRSISLARESLLVARATARPPVIYRALEFLEWSLRQANDPGHTDEAVVLLDEMAEIASEANSQQLLEYVNERRASLRPRGE